MGRISMRVYIVLQTNRESLFSDTDVVGVYTSAEKAEHMREKCSNLYDQYYYIQTVVLDEDNVGK
jgi:hypothetical protein